MKAWERDDLIATVARVLTMIDGRVTALGRPAADWRRLSGDMRSTGEARLAAGTFAADMAGLWPVATGAGVGDRGWRVVHGLILADQAAGAAVSLPGQAVQVAALRLGLVERVRLSTGRAFASRGEAVALRDDLAARFDEAILVASDLGDVEAQGALLTLNAAMIRDLTDRGRALARIVRYESGVAVPSLVLAQRLYADASRADDLRGMNAVRHPAFMPLAGEALGT